jgi:hypothetical protein
VPKGTKISKPLTDESSVTKKKYLKKSIQPVDRLFYVIIRPLLNQNDDGTGVVRI